MWIMPHQQSEVFGNMKCRVNVGQLGRWVIWNVLVISFCVSWRLTASFVPLWRRSGDMYCFSGLIIIVYSSIGRVYGRVLNEYRPLE